MKRDNGADRKRRRLGSRLRLARCKKRLPQKFWLVAFCARSSKGRRCRSQSKNAVWSRPACIRHHGYPKQQFRHVKSPRVSSIDISEDGKSLNIFWEDEHKSQFHAIWLRHNCHCPSCRLDHNGMKSSIAEDIDLDIRLIGAEIEDNEILLLRWQHSNGHTHDGPIPLAWLRIRCRSPAAEAERTQARAMVFHEDKVIPEIEYEDVINSDLGLYEWMCHLGDRGICLVKNCPLVDGTVAKVAERIAPLQHTIYGETFEVKSMPQPINAAYSPVSLASHMDQIMYECAPGLQLLHCLQFDSYIVGGENTFTDIFELAHQLREERPDYFDTLTRVPVTMSTIHYNRDYPVHMTCKRPMLALNGNGELITIYWHPMLAEIDAVEENIEPFFEAYKHFYLMVQNSQSVYKLRMVDGDMITFNNRRVLHGRAPYCNQRGLRLFQGTYLELSEFQSRLQVFHNLYGDGRLASRVGMADWQ
ncbi:gamma-butyrobetaine dioxygenase [Plakobranchus ocellatus]|uniref:Gamma-butyrobetaine dioxygenase n=1 Tax=Plakobranchus ocellatus TaxID=259542 RepID=A0AAV4CF03_9GAST|nr:gamma-butyrobetaine dioxygenase [Plakobranchus ocellatus]